MMMMKKNMANIPDHTRSHIKNTQRSEEISKLVASVEGIPVREDKS